MVSDPFLVGIFFGFVPAMGLLYLLLHEYQALFSEKRIFRSFFLGLLMGLVVTVLEQFTSPTVLQLLGATITRWESLGMLGVFSLLLGLVEALAFAAFLNWKTFRGRRDTPFYGVAFGLGFGATNVLFLMAMILATRSEAGTGAGWVDAILLSLLGLYFVGGILVHGAMGAWVGRGTGQGGLPRALTRALLVRAVYVALFYALLLVRTPGVSHALALGGVTFGIVLVWRVMHDVLDKVVPPEVLREMGIHQRRLARRVLRQETDEEAPR